MKKNRFELTEKHRKLLATLAIVIFAVLFILVGYFVGKPALEFVKEPEKFRLWVDEHGLWGKMAYVGMVFVQVLVAIVPGEPFEIGGGYAFGAVEGTLLSLVGAAVGGILVFLFVRRFGIRAVEIFFPSKDIHSLRFLRKTPKRDGIFFLLFMLPGTPKDLLCYFAGLTDMKFSTWLVICTAGRLPSIITSTIGGSALGEKNYVTAVVSFVLAIALAAAGWLIYKRICKKRENKE